MKQVLHRVKEERNIILQ